ncbi:MAG: N-acetylmuramoyl-L-alanine amidase [Chloroflexi bacterium]|nr:N-acetylmuramoyl-L-alanine amidase [Chloroflexota bacterium]
MKPTTRKLVNVLANSLVILSILLSNILSGSIVGQPARAPSGPPTTNPPVSLVPATEDAPATAVAAAPTGTIGATPDTLSATKLPTLLPTLQSDLPIANARTPGPTEIQSAETPAGLPTSTSAPQSITSTPQPTNPPPIFDGKISPATGGIVTSPDGQVTVIFAPGAVEAAAIGHYTYTRPRNLPPSLRLAGALAFNVTVQSEADGTLFPYFPALVTTTTYHDPELNVDRAVYDAQPRVKVMIQFSRAGVAGLQEKFLSLYRQDPETSTWHTVPTVIDTVRHTTYSEIEYGGHYALLGWPDVSATAATKHGGYKNARILFAALPPASQKVVVLNPDHGGPDPHVAGCGGRVTSPPDKAACEKTYNLIVAQQVSVLLGRCGGIQVIMTRTDNETTVSREMRTDIINSNNPDAAVTLAFNVTNGIMTDTTGTGSGIEQWVNFDKPGDMAFGEQMNKRVSEFAPLPIRTPGVKNAANNPGGPIYVALHVTPLFTHAELAFMDNIYDRTIMDDPAGMGAIANGVTVAIIDQLGGISVCTNPDFQLPDPLSAADRARLYDLAYQNWMRYRGDPVNTSTGNHVQQFTDLQIPGVGGFDFALQRTYNSLDLFDLEGWQGVFGKGWASLLDMHLRLANDGSIDVRRPDGQGIYFVTEGDGYAPGQDGVFDTLARNGPDFMLRTPDQLFYHFKLFGFRGLLMAVNDRHGNTITFERDDDGHVTRIIDSAGREYNLTYEGEHIASITDLAERTIRYEYNADGDLIRVTDANQGVYQFEYADHRMTKLTDPVGILYLQNIYDTEGRVVEQIDAGSSHDHFNYDTDGQTLFADNLSNPTIDKYDDLSRVTETQDGLPQIEKLVYDDDYNVTTYTDKRGNTWTSTYDDRGNLLTLTDPLSHTTTHTYNATNDLTSITDPGGPGDAPRTTTFVYDGDGNLILIERPDSTKIRAEYDSHGQMVKLIDPNQHPTIFTFDAQGNLIKVTDSIPNQTQYGYDAVGRRTSMTDANGHTVSFQHDGNDNVTRITDPKGQSVTFTYDLNDNLKQMVDRRGGVTKYEYDVNLKLIAETDPEGHRTTYGYDAMYNRTSMTDPRGNVTTYRYDAIYQLIEVEDALHGRTRFVYDPNGNVVRLSDALTQTTVFEYDALNRLTKQTDILSGITSFEYDAVGRLTLMTNPRSAKTKYTYDLLDRLTLLRDPLDGKWQFGYDAVGNVISATDANNNTATSFYDTANRLIKHVDADSKPTLFFYDGVGNTKKVVDALNNTTLYNYDANDNLERITDSLTGVTAMAHDAEDNLAALTDANGHTTLFDHDLDGLLTKVTEGGGQITTYRYDAAHNLVSYTNARNNTWTYAYDELNRRISQTDPLDQIARYEYDPLSRMIRITNERNIVTRQDYDGLGRLVAAVQNYVQGGPSDAQTNVATRYVYDAVGNLTNVTDANSRASHFEYDLNDRLTQFTANGGQVRKYDYDPVGNLVKYTNARGNIWLYGYDALNRRINETDPLSHTTRYEYDALSRMTGITDGNTNTTRQEYDALGRLAAVIQNYRPGGPTDQQTNVTTRYTYDAVGNLKTSTDAKGAKTSFDYDEVDRLTQKIDSLTGVWKYEYDAVGNLTAFTNPRNARTEYTYDALDRPTLMRDALSGERKADYDAVGNITSVTDANQHHTTLHYDALDRLTERIDAASHSTFFAYDGVGNTIGVTDELNRLTRYTYDANDNLITVTDVLDGVTAMAYDAEDNLTAFTDANGHTARFTYNADDLLVESARFGGQTRHYGYDAAHNLISYTNARGNTWKYTYDPLNRRLSEIDPGSHITRHGYDALGQTTSMTDGNGNPTRQEYDALGRMTAVIQDYQPGGPGDPQTNVTTRYTYDAVGNQTAMIDANGNQTTFEYDLLDRQTQKIDSLGGIWQYEYDAVGNLKTETNPRNAQTKYTYDELDRLTLKRDALGGEWGTGYDAIGNITSTIDANSHRVLLRYDDLNRLVERLDAGGHPTSFEYDHVGNITAVTDALSRVTRYGYDANYNLETITDTLGGVTTMAHDAEDNLTAFTDANDHASHFDYNADDLLVKFTEAGGQETGYQYDAAHNLTVRTNAKGNTWAYTYDPLNRRISEKDPLNHVTTYGYDALGQTIRLTDANGVKTRYDYDALSRLIAVVQNEQPGSPGDQQTNVTTRYAYDAVDNLTKITDANGEKTTFDYDLLDRLTEEVNPLHHRWQYEHDAVGNLTVRTDANGDVTRYTYNADDLLTRIDYPDDTGIGLGYDKVHNQTEMTDSLGVTHNEYDALNRLTASTNHIGQRVGYTYDPVGNRTSLTYPDGRKVTYDYDGTNFVKRVTDPEGNIFDVTRDATHNATKVQNPNDTVARYDFDAAERLVSVQNHRNSGEVISTFAYTLDAVGNRTRTAAQYGSGQPSQVTTDYGYDPLYRLIHSEDSQGHFTDYTFDAVGNRLSQTTNFDPVTGLKNDVLTTTYDYDAANELIAVLREVTPSGVPDLPGQTAQVLHAFIHETEAQSGKHIEEATATGLLDQAKALAADLEGDAPPDAEAVAADLAALQAAVEAAGAEGRIDNAGIVNSLLVKLRDAGKTNQGGGGKGVAVTLYDYDRNGNRVARSLRDKGLNDVRGWSRTDYGYDFENRLSQVQNSRAPDHGNKEPGDETLLTYDGYGRLFRRLHDQRASTSLNTGGGQKWVDSVYDGLDPIAEYEEPGAHYSNYYRGLGRILSMQPIQGGSAGNILHYYHYDGLGSVTAMTQDPGQSEHDYRYSDYGIILGNNGHAADASNFTDPHNHFTYTGQEWDEELSLYHFYAREYEPETGVWVQPDPYRGQLEMPMTLHRYEYVGGNPIRYSDKDGYFLNVLAGAAGGAIFGGGANAVIQYATTGKVDWNEVKASAVGGAVSGALCLGTLVGCAIGGAAGGATTQIAKDLLNNNWDVQKIQWGEVGMQATIGTAPGIASKFISGGIWKEAFGGTKANLFSDAWWLGNKMPAIRPVITGNLFRQVFSLRNLLWAGREVTESLIDESLQKRIGENREWFSSRNNTAPPSELVCYQQPLGCYNNRPPMCYSETPMCYANNHGSAEEMYGRTNEITNLVNSYIRKGKSYYLQMPFTSPPTPTLTSLPTLTPSDEWVTVNPEPNPSRAPANGIRDFHWGPIDFRDFIYVYRIPKVKNAGDVNQCRIQRPGRTEWKACTDLGNNTPEDRKVYVQHVDGSGVEKGDFLEMRLQSREKPLVQYNKRYLSK